MTSWPGTINAKEASGDWAGYWKYVIGTDANLHAGDAIAVIANDGVDQSGKQTESGNITAGSTWLLTADGEWKDVGGSYKPPRVTVTPEAKEFTDTLTVTVTATNCTDVSYTVNDEGSQPLQTTGGKFTVGEGDAGKYKVTVTGKSEHETVEINVTYTKTAAEPEAQTVLTVYVSNKFVHANAGRARWICANEECREIVNIPDTSLRTEIDRCLDRLALSPALLAPCAHDEQQVTPPRTSSG